MVEKFTGFFDYFRKIPIGFLIAIIVTLGLILFLPGGLAKAVGVDGSREQYRVYLGPVFLLAVSFCVARGFMFFVQKYKQRKALTSAQDSLHTLTPEEKGYLLPFIADEMNSISVGLDDGVMGGLCAKGITYRATNMGTMLGGMAFNLQPWARDYLEQNLGLLNGAMGRPMTPRQKLDRSMGYRSML